MLSRLGKSTNRGLLSAKPTPYSFSVMKDTEKFFKGLKSEIKDKKKALTGQELSEHLYKVYLHD